MAAQFHADIVHDLSISKKRGTVLKVILFSIIIFDCIATSYCKNTDSTGNYESCDFSTETKIALEKWLNGGELLESDLMELSCIASSVAEAGASVLGATVGGYYGSSLGRWFGKFLGDDYRDTVHTASRLFGAYLGYQTAQAILKKTSLRQRLRNYSPTTLRERCLNDFDLGNRQVWSRLEVETSYRRAALMGHPDRGGSQEDMIHLNLCKTVLLAAVV